MLDRGYFIDNRKKLAERLENGSVAVLHSGDELRKSRDVFFPFFANRNFFYYVGVNEPQAIFVIVKDHFGETKEYYFNEKRDSETEKWFGKRLDKEQLDQVSGVKLHDTSDKFYGWLTEKIQSNNYNVYLDLHYFDGKHDEDYARAISREIMKDFPWISIKDLHTIVSCMRNVKDDREIKEMESGIAIAQKAFLRMMNEAAVGMTEYQLKAIWDYEVAMQGIRDMAFQPIITTGKSNFVIHYSDYTKTIKRGDIILCDAGVNHCGLCCDISRSWPVDKWFTLEQEKFYRCMLDCSNEMFEYTKPGRTMRDLYRTQIHIMRRRMVEYGIANDENDANRYIWHHGAHHIGFDNHDEVDIKNHPNQLVEKNMVYAIDIGIYDIEKKIGFRIEDDCLITEDGSRNLTACIPRELDELKDVLEMRKQ